MARFRLAQAAATEATLSDTAGVESGHESGHESALTASWLEHLQPSKGFAAGIAHWHRTAEEEAEGAAPDLAVTEAFNAGFAAGREAERELSDARESSYRRLQLRFGEMDKAALEAVEQALMRTVQSLCEETMAPFAIDPEALSQRCRKAAEMLGASAKDCALHLHPDDAEFLDQDWAKQWRIMPDPEMERGSILFESADGAVSDGPEEWRAAIASAIGHPI